MRLGQIFSIFKPHMPDDRSRALPTLSDYFESTAKEIAEVNRVALFRQEGGDDAMWRKDEVARRILDVATEPLRFPRDFERASDRTLDDFIIEQCDAHRQQYGLPVKYIAFKPGEGQAILKSHGRSLRH